MRTWRKASFALLVSGITLATLEGVCRIFPPVPVITDGAALPPDPDLLWRQPYGEREENGIMIRINSLGMRGPEVAPKQADERRVVSIGDSSVFAFLVQEENSYTSVACKEMDCTPMLLASGGYSTVQSLVWLERVGTQLEPDWIVIGNLWSDQSIVGFQDKDLVRDYSVYRSSWQWSLLRLSRQSALFNRLRSLYIGDSKQEKRDIAWQNGWNQGATGSPRVPIDEYAQNIEALVALSQSLGAQVAFVGLAKQAEVEGAYDGLAIQYRAVLQEAAALANAPYIDALRVWQESGVSSQELFADFLHPSAKGHYLLGLALSQALGDSSLLDE